MVVGEVEAEHCGACQHLPKAETPSLGGLCPLDEWKRLIPEEGLGPALWRSKRSKMRGEETCC